MSRRAMALAALVASLACGAAIAAPANCESIRAGIEAKLERSGLKGYRLQVVDAEAKVPGKVVGSCELGSRKIVYTASAASAPAPAAAPARTDRILTECRDGTTTYGDCPR